MALKVLDYAGLGRLLAGLEKRYIKDRDTIYELTVTNGIDVRGTILTPYLIFPDESYSAFAGFIGFVGDYKESQPAGMHLMADNFIITPMSDVGDVQINAITDDYTPPSAFNWHAGSATSWADFVLGNVTAHGKIAKAGGKATQFLMADGSVKELTDFDNDYVTRSTHQEIAGKKTFKNYSVYVQHDNVSTGGSALGLVILNQAGSTNGGVGTLMASNNTFRYTYLGWGSSPWAESTCLAVADSMFQYKGNNVLHAGNYSSILDSRYYTESEINTKLTNGSVTKVGTATVGSAYLPVFLSAGVPTAVSGIAEGYLAWGGRSISGDFGPLDAALVPELGANRFAGAKPEGITVEYSTDGGTTWKDYGATDAQKLQLTMGGNVVSSFVIGKGSTASPHRTAGAGLRITFDTGKCKIYTYLKKILMLISSNGSVGCTVKMERALKSTPSVWVNAGTYNLSGWSGWNVLGIAGFTTYGNNAESQYGRIRFTFSHTGNTSAYDGLEVYSIQGFGGVGWATPTTLAKTGRVYSYDYEQNVTFPARITATQVASNVATGIAPFVVSSTTKVANLNADLLDGYHAGYENGQIPVYVSFPSHARLVDLGYNDQSTQTDNEAYLKGICKWAIDTYPTGGLLIGIGTPSSAGNLQIQLYANGKDAETGLPRHCSGVYYGLSGKIYPFRVENYVWYFGCTINANADTATTASMATLLSGGRKINGTSFTNISDITTALWGTARNIYVQDHTGAHYGGAVSVNGSADVRLKLPSVMDLATLNVTTAVWLNGTSAMLRGKGKYGGFNLYAGYSAVANEIFRIDGENTDGTFACNIMKSDISGNVAFGPSNVDAAYRMLIKGNAKVDGALSTGGLRVTGDVTIDGEAYCTLLGASTVEADSIQTNTLNIGSDGVHYDPQMNAIVFEGNVIINGSFLNG